MTIVCHYTYAKVACPHDVAFSTTHYLNLVAALGHLWV